jgi:hypothetical protein
VALVNGSRGRTCLQIAGTSRRTAPPAAGVVDVAGENDGLAGQLAVCIAYAVVHQVAQDHTVGILVEDGVVDGGLASKLKSFGSMPWSSIWAICSSAQVRSLDAISQELGRVGNHLEGDQIAVGNGLLEWVVGGGKLVVATEKLAGAAADHLHRRGSQANLQGVEVFEESP